MASSTPYLWASCTLLVAHILWRKLLWHRRSKGYKLPPSPRRGYPLLGHALDVPRSNEHVVFREWSKELGRDIFYLDAAGTPIVVVNTIELATEMLEKRSRIYSSRPGSIMMNDLMGWGWVISNLPYGEKWKERRKLFQRHFSPANKASHQFCEQEHISKLLVKLLDSPDGFMGHTRHMVGGIAYSIAYGLSVQPNNDPYIQLAEAAIKSAVEAAVPGAFLVDFVPALRYVPEWVPGAGFKKKAREWKRLNNKMRNKPFEEAEAQINEGIARPSFIRKALEDLDTSGNVAHQREVIQDTAGMVFAAAADTTTSALCTFFLAMMCYPKVQKRAQEELDRVLGIGTLPQSEDENRLPYINAIVKEVLRLIFEYHEAEVPESNGAGVPHLSSEDDIFNDYFIPQGTIIIANTWAMLHNEHEYPNPEEFIPERFLGSNPARDPSSIAFGFGRRQCPGAHIGQSTLWLTAASVLSLFDISKPVGPDGAVAETTVEYDGGVIVHPKPFECNITPRSLVAVKTIRSLCT